MAQQPDAFWFCLNCGAESEAAAQFCHDCGAALHEQRGHDRRGVAFLLNELHALHTDGAIGDELFLRLRERYREVLRQLGARPVPQVEAPQPEAEPEARPDRQPAGPEEPSPVPARPAPEAQPSGPGWLAEQQANLLLYLGAFLIVIAALTFVSASADSISDRLRMALVALGTLLFLAVGTFCLRIPRVRQAGIVFFAVGALMVPVNFVAGYAFFLADEDIDGTSLWLAGSLASALFYAAVSLLRIGRWYPVPMAVALASSLGALLTLIETPAEVYPASFIGLAFVFAAPALLRLGRIDDVFGLIGAWAAHLVVPLAFIASLVMIESEGVSGALAAALAAAVFYAVVSWQGMGRWDLVPRNFYPIPLALAMLASFGLALALGDASDAAYPASFIGLAFVFAAPALLRLGRIDDVFGLVGSWAAQLVAPLAFVASLAMIESEGVSGALAASLAAAVFYAVVSWQGMGRWDPVPRELYPAALALALLSSLGLALAVGDAPAEVYPGSFIGLGFVFAAPALLRLGRIDDVFGRAGSWAAHLVVPLAFIASLVLIESEGVSGALAASLAAAVFYAAVSWQGMGRWVPVPREFYSAALALTLLSSLGLALVVGGAPEEVYPGSFIALALALAAPSMLPAGRVRDTFGLNGGLAANAVVPPAMVAALLITVAGDPGADDTAFSYTTRWYLPPTAGIAVLFYAAQAIWTRRAYPQTEPYLAVASLAVAGGAAVALVFALDVGEQWYGPAVAIVAWIYAAGSERFGPRWFGQRFLAPLALAAITVSWLAFEWLYADFARNGAGVHFAAAALYLGAARVMTLRVPISGLAPNAENGAEREPITIPASVGLIYAAGITIGVGFYHLLASLPAAETAGASDLSLAFFGLSLGIAAVVATARWWWPELRLHGYLIALGISLFVVLAAVGSEGQVALLLAVYTAVALALALWEREPLALSIPAVFGFFALLAAWRHYEPIDLYLPLALSAVGYALFAVYIGLRGRSESWSRMTLVLGIGYVLAAPITGWVRLSILADDAGFIAADSFEETALYQTAAGSVLLLGLMAIAQGWIVRRVEIAAGGTALLMVALMLEVGHFRPENVQAYSAPLGVYVLLASMLATRARGLSRDVRAILPGVQVLGAVILMGPSLGQSWQEGGWPYALILLGEGLVLLSLALVQRWVWLLSTSVGFIVLDAFQYLLNGAQTLPPWAILAIAGSLVMAAGTAILLGRERWTEWQRSVRTWWESEPATARSP